MRTISVTAPLSQALSRVSTVLFQPFDLGKWFTIGFCAWLAYLGQAGGGGGFHGGDFGGKHGDGADSIREGLERARDFITSNIGWLAPLAIGLVLIMLVVWLVILWVSSRGRFMFLHCVARNTAEVVGPWKTFAEQANSLFVFRVVVSLVSLLLFLPLLGALALVILRMLERERATPEGIIMCVGLVLAMCLLGIFFWIITRLTEDFVVPIQAVRRVRCLQAWRVLRTLAAGNLGNLFLYFLFRIVLGIALSLIVLVAVVVTCCILGCFLAIPYIGTVLLLPVLVLARSYSLYYLAQFGPEYDAFLPPAASGAAEPA